jgi:hypothetical protein
VDFGMTAFHKGKSMLLPIDECITDPTKVANQFFPPVPDKFHPIPRRWVDIRGWSEELIPVYGDRFWVIRIQCSRLLCYLIARLLFAPEVNRLVIEYHAVQPLVLLTASHANRFTCIMSRHLKVKRPISNLA